MNKEVLEKIIEAGNLAPSGGNSQSWKFRVRGNEIDVIGLVERDHKILNVGGRGTYIGNGAVLENMKHAANALGFVTTFSFFPKEDVVATLSFSKGSKDSEDLNSVISKRSSNRKPYSNRELTKEEKEYILEDLNAFSNLDISIVEGEQKEQAAKCVAHDILLNMQNKELHDLLFDEVLWTEEEQKEKAGLYVKTMEAVPPKSFAFKLLENWGVAKFFSKIGLINKIYEESSQTVASSSALGAILVSNKDEDFIHVGRLLENVWLRATKLGLSMQIHAGVIFLAHQVKCGTVDIFSDQEKEKLVSLDEELRDLFKVPEDKVIGIIFRIGESKPPLATSYKRPPVVEWSN